MATFKDFLTHFSVGVSDTKRTKNGQTGDDHDAGWLLEAQDQTGRVLRVAFHRHGDRLAHSISAGDGRNFVPIVSSVEGDGQQAWPPSPPIQQLDREPGHPVSNVLLGLGMAGRSHWSISALARHTPLSLVFEVACRAHGRVARLGSCYRPIVQPARLEGSAAVFELPFWSVRLEVESTGEAPAELRWDDAHLAIVTTADPASDPFTYRWRYHVSAP